MIKNIIKETNVLSQKSERFIFGEDNYLIQDMLDTANAHKERCVGLACIQIGIPKKIIVVRNTNLFVPMINPCIIKKSTSSYIATEMCLSIDGEHQVKRHDSIRVAYQTPQGKQKVQDFKGFLAQVIQHECDHLNGILI